MQNLKKNKSIEIKIEQENSIKEKNKKGKDKSLEFIKTKNNFRENIKTFNNIRANSTKNINNLNFNEIDTPKKFVNNNKIKNPFSENNRYKINNNINNNKYNIPKFNPNKSQSSTNQYQPKNISNKIQNEIILNNNYINSILHCFLNIKKLNEFFLSKKYDLKN
jgi:hypothetical protein